MPVFGIATTAIEKNYDGTDIVALDGQRAANGIGRAQFDWGAVK
jgi:hypothetical protein